MEYKLEAYRVRGISKLLVLLVGLSILALLLGAGVYEPSLGQELNLPGEYQYEVTGNHAFFADVSFLLYYEEKPQSRKLAEDAASAVRGYAVRNKLDVPDLSGTLTIRIRE